jgi:hypothetical protein
VDRSMCSSSGLRMAVLAQPLWHNQAICQALAKPCGIGPCIMMGGWLAGRAYLYISSMRMTGYYFCCWVVCVCSLPTCSSPAAVRLTTGQGWHNDAWHVCMCPSLLYSSVIVMAQRALIRTVQQLTSSAVLQHNAAALPAVFRASLVACIER